MQQQITMYKRETIWRYVSDLLHDVSIDCFMNEVFATLVWRAWHGRNVDAHALHIILYILHLTTKAYSSPNREIIHIDIL